MTKELAEKLDVMKRLFNDAPLVKEYNQLMDDLERRRVNTRRVRLGLLLAAGCRCLTTVCYDRRNILMN